MADNELVRVAVETHFKNGWKIGAVARTPVAYANNTFTPTANVPWVRLSLSEGRGANASIGSKHQRFGGIIYVQVFGVINTGEQVVKQLADEAAALFENVILNIGALGKLTCRVPSVETRGADGAWYQLNVVVPYYRDSLKP